MKKVVLYLDFLNFLILFYIFIFSIIIKKCNNIKNKNTYNSKYLKLESLCISTRISNQNISLENCLISYLYSNIGNGGAVNIETSCNLLINETTFYECVSLSGFGGAIYFSYGISAHFFKTCGLYCRTASLHLQQFAKIDCKNNIRLDLVAISKCYNQSLAHRTLELYEGIQYIFNTNISFNFNIDKSGIYYLCPTDMYSNYCTFHNNSVSSMFCIYLVCNIGNISKTNIIKNYCPKNGVVYV